MSHCTYVCHTGLQNASRLPCDLDVTAPPYIQELRLKYRNEKRPGVLIATRPRGQAYILSPAEADAISGRGRVLKLHYRFVPRPTEEA